MHTLTTDQMRAIRDNQATAKIPVINVLPADQFRVAHIPGTTNIPLDDPAFEPKVEQCVGSKSAAVIVYGASRSSDLSPRAAQRLEQAGFHRVFDYAGGTEDWQDAGLTLEAAPG